MARTLAIIKNIVIFMIIYAGFKYITGIERFYYEVSWISFALTCVVMLVFVVAENTVKANALVEASENICKELDNWAGGGGCDGQ